MRCEEVRMEIAAGVTGEGMEAPAGSLSDHVDSCDSCRAWLGNLEDLRASMTPFARPDRPEAGYWNSLLPRIRHRIERHLADQDRVALRIVLPASAALLLLFFFHFMAVTPPGTAGIGQAVTALSEGELYEIEQTQRYSGLLGVYENGAGSDHGGSSMVQLLKDLLSDEPFSAYYASLDPVEIVSLMDEAEFSQFVDILEKRQ